MIGDGCTASLIGGDGALDFLCWPDFDGDACFAALLGTARHGVWRIWPEAEPVEVARAYQTDTLVLETNLRTPDGSVGLIEFMPPGGPGASPVSSVIRIVEGRAGSVTMLMECAPRFGFGARVPTFARIEGGVIASIGAERMVLRTSVRLDIEDGVVRARFSIAAGERVNFSLGWGDAAADDALTGLADTQAHWRAWCARGTAHGPLVTRSLITLKSLCHTPTGALIAAATTSLPEQPGGTRNWDYRYCWVRDSALMLSAMMQAGHGAEMVAWLAWLERAAGPLLQSGGAENWRVLYRLDGTAPPAEHSLPWLPGHNGAAPVRVGNAAADQLQLDPIGELAEALHIARTRGVIAPEAGWALQRALLMRLATIWAGDDAGIWEIRGPLRPFCFSRLMAWVAFDRAIADATRWRLPGPVDLWRTIAAAIRTRLLDAGFDRRFGSFMQYEGATTLDASLLLLPGSLFLPPGDPLVRGTIDAIAAGLGRDGLIWRYGSDSGVDGLPPGEGAFIACGFWLAEALARTGRHDEARSVFARHAALANDVGLLSEEYDVISHAASGNIPQGLSHAALISAAIAIDDQA